MCIRDSFKSEDVKLKIFKEIIKKGGIVKAIPVKNTDTKPRSFFDGLDNWAKDQGSSGLAYFTLEKNENISGKGPVGKFFSSDACQEIMKISNAEIGDSIFFARRNSLCCSKIFDGGTFQG